MTEQRDAIIKIKIRRMKLKEFISWVSFLLWATVLSVPHSTAQQTTTGSSVVSSSGSSNNKPVALSLEFDSFAQFINDAFNEMKLSGNIAIPGLGDADKTSLKNSKVVLDKIVPKRQDSTSSLIWISPRGEIR